MAEKKSISIHICGRPYPLKVDAAEEKNILAIVEELNRKLDAFEKMYVKNDKQDYLAMLLLTYAVDLKNRRDENPNQSNENVDWATPLDSIEKLVKTLL